MANPIIQVPVDEVKPFLDRESPKDSFADLVDSITKHGVIVPITVTALSQKKRSRKKARSASDRWFYQLVKGHRRLRAAKVAGLKSVPAFLVPLDSKQRVKDFFVENEVRNDLTPYEKAVLMDGDRGKLSIPEIASKYTISERAIRRSLTVLECASEELLHYIQEGRISMREAEPIAALSPREQSSILKDILAKDIHGTRIGRFVKTVRRSTEDAITRKSIKAQTGAVVKLLREKEHEYEQVRERYNKSALLLERALQHPAIRIQVDKAGIDYTRFYSD